MNTKAPFVLWLIVYMFVMNMITFSLSYSTNNEFQGNFSKPGNIFDFAGQVYNYLFKLTTFSVSGVDPIISFFIFYLPVLAIIIIIVEIVRGN